MNGVKHVIRWEVMRNLRNKQFLIGMFLTPFIFAVFAVVPSLIERLDRPSISHYGVVDAIGGFEALKEYVPPDRVALHLEASAESAAERVREGEIRGYFILDDALITTGVAELYVKDARRSPPNELRVGLTQYLQRTRIELMGMDPQAVSFVTAQAALEPRLLEDDAEARGLDVPRLVTVGVCAALFALLIFGSGAMLLQSALQEKRDRMSEVVLSSISPKTLMAGKIVGHLILGVIQIAVWVTIGLVLIVFVVDAPVLQMVAWDVLPLVFVFFLFGYLFFAAIFIGVGATMEDIQSAGNAQGMVFMLPFVAMLFLFPTLNNPDGVAARIGSFIPFSSPFIVMLRTVLGDPPLWEMIAACAVLLVSTVIVVLLAAKLFRVGMLMYGKSATPREIWRWLRHG